MKKGKQFEVYQSDKCERKKRIGYICGRSSKHLGSVSNMFRCLQCLIDVGGNDSNIGGCVLVD
jgi:hypothetical protein